MAAIARPHFLALTILSFHPFTGLHHTFDTPCLIRSVQPGIGLNPFARPSQIPTELRVRGVEKRMVFPALSAVSLQVVLHHPVQKPSSNARTLPLRHHHQPRCPVGIGCKQRTNRQMRHELPVYRSHKIFGSRRVPQV